MMLLCLAKTLSDAQGAPGVLVTTASGAALVRVTVVSELCVYIQNVHAAELPAEDALDDCVPLLSRKRRIKRL